MLHAGGLFNGDATGKFGAASHRADIPRPTVKLASATTTSPTPEKTGQAMDIRRAVFIERTQPSESISVEQRWYAHATRPSLLVHEIEVTNMGQSATITLGFGGINGPIGSSEDVVLSLCDAGQAAGRLCVFGQNKMPEDATTPTGGNHTALAIVANSPCSGVNATQCTATVPIGSGSHTLYYVAVIVTSLNSTQPTADAQRMLDEALAHPEGLLEEHETAWAERWARGSIEVDGDLRLAQAVNASLYVLRASIRVCRHRLFTSFLPTVLHGFAAVCA